MKIMESEQSSKAFYSGHPGVVLVGHLINGSRDLCEWLEREVAERAVISHADVGKTSLGLLCPRKSDVEAAEGGCRR